MFDVGFSELALIFGVSLVVLGPKRLPGLVSKVGRWVGKARAMATDFRRQLENEVNLEELNKLTETQSRAARASPMDEPPPGSPPGDPYSATEPAPDASSYPYSAQESSTADTAAAQEPAASEVLPAGSAHTDDTYSHAHAAGDTPMADVQEYASASGPRDEDPLQADLDLSVPEDHSHLPPDDARRYS